MKHVRYAVCVSVVLSLFSNCVHASLCNNKYNNLVQLQSMLQGAQGVQVPTFLSISSKRIENFLNAHDPGIFATYRDVVLGLQELLRASDISKDDYEVLLYYAQGVQARIRNAFHFSDMISFFTQQELDFFDVVAQKKHFLMARSSGLEDSKTTANAGLFVSVPYVAPNATDISHAIGEVVASYFDFQAMKNNLNAGLDLPTMDLCIPVLIQELVGEPFGGTDNAEDIPVSGVAFTTNTSLSSDAFAVTEINVSYGHGEGIVESKVPTDRYYVIRAPGSNDALSIYPVIVSKPKRLVPQRNADGRSELVMQKNPADYIKRSCLQTDQIERLYTVLKKIEATYGYPTDIEFVIKNNGIYIVQARPAMSHAKTPGYIPEQNLADGDTSKRFTGSTIIPGSSQVQIITNQDDVLIKNTLDEADGDDRRATAKVVLVGSWASPLSHAAVNFMGVGTPCIYVQNMPMVKDVVRGITPQTPLVVDVQRQQIYLWQNTQKPVQDLVVYDWYEHPIARTLSLIGLDTNRLVRHESIIPQDAELVSQMLALKNALGTDAQMNIFNTIKQRIADRVALTEKRIQNMSLLCDQKCQHTFFAFKAYIQKLIHNFEQSFATGADRFELLFYHKMLEALLYQEDGNALNTYTYRWFLDDLYFKQLIYGKVQQPSELLAYGQYCPKDLLATWQSVVSEIQKNIKKGNGLFAMHAHELEVLLGLLEQVDGLPLWFATSFYESIQSYKNDIAGNVVSLVDALVANFTAIGENIPRVQELRETLADSQRALDLSVATYADAQKLWDVITDTLIVPLTHESFIAEFNNVPKLMKLLLCSEMRQVIDTIDAAIKKIKATTSISLEDRKRLFLTMLQGFFNVSDAWLKNIMPENSIEYNSLWPLRNYLREQKKILDSLVLIKKSISLSLLDRVKIYIRDPKKLFAPIKPDDEFFKKSQGFSVQAAMLGSKTAFQRHYPQTPEDMFMLIHQNSLLAVSATFMSVLGVGTLQESLYMPAFLYSVMDVLQATNKIDIKIIGIEYTPTSITLLYNMPMRNHSGTLQIVYDANTQETRIQCQFLGQARERWQHVALLAASTPELSNLMLVDNRVIFDYAAGLVSWAWIVPDIQTLYIIIDYLVLMIQMSFRSGSPSAGGSSYKFYNYDYTRIQTMGGTLPTMAAIEDAFQRALPKLQQRIQGTLYGNWYVEVEQLLPASERSIIGRVRSLLGL